MSGLHRRVATYNFINIFSTITVIIVIYLNTSVWLSWYLLRLEDDIIVIVIWPIMLLFAIIQLNKKLMRKFIHRQNETMYKANNVTIDKQVDSGSLDQSAWDALPSSNIEGLRTKTCADLAFYGTLDDIGIKYKIDAFDYELTFRRRNETHLAGQITGDALIIDIEESSFGTDWTVFINNHVNFSQMKIKQANEEVIISGNSFGKLLYNNDVAFSGGFGLGGNSLGKLLYNNDVERETISKIRNIISSNPKIFNGFGKVVAMFKEDKFIYITTYNHKFKINLPLVITKSKRDKIIVNQKAQVYRFNQFLIDISRMLDL